MITRIFYLRLVSTISWTFLLVSVVAISTGRPKRSASLVLVIQQRSYIVIRSWTFLVYGLKMVFKIWVVVLFWTFLECNQSVISYNFLLLVFEVWILAMDNRISHLAFRNYLLDKFFSSIHFLISVKFSRFLFHISKWFVWVNFDRRNRPKKC